jgi:glycosyltransferase involved in cell wall biosynthesis
VPPARPDLLAAAVQDVLDRPDAARERARAAKRSFGREFTAEVMTGKTEALYREILGRSSL